MPLYEKVIEPKTTVNSETNEELSKEVVKHLEETQERIYEINYNQKDYHLRKKELNATLEGLHAYFTRLGFGEIECYYLMKDLDIQKEIYSN